MQSNLKLISVTVLLFGVNVLAQRTVPNVTNAPQAIPAGPQRQGANPGRVPLKTSTQLKLQPIQTTFPITNPQSSQNDNVIIAVLTKQKTAAQMEASQMPAIHPGGAPSTMPSGNLNRAGATQTGMLQKAPTVGTLGPGQTMGSGPNGSSISRLSGNLSATQSAVLVCGQDPTMRILTVSGDSHPATFTQDDRYNFYTITGCSFGNPGPNAKVYIYYKDSFHQQFQIQEWRENLIKLNLDRNLRGVMDQDNLTLVVQRNDGKQATKDGYKFYAARETTLLTFFPQGSFSLDKFTPTNTSDLKVQYSSPSSTTLAPYVKGYTAGISWQCSDCDYNQSRPTFSHYTPAETDIYDFKGLKPGFLPYQAAMGQLDLQCPSGDVHREGNFNMKWTQGQLWVSWQGQTCTTQGCGGFGQPDCFIAPPGSNYALNIWVQGPRGVDPWTGKPR
jgi:hypothetical protein